MNILVTGASGFVGRHLCAALVDNGAKVSAVVRNSIKHLKGVKLFIKELNDETNWQDTLKDIDVVVHLAGRAHVMKESVEDSYQIYADTNIHATRHLAEQSALAGVKRFIFLSSIKVNGESTDKTAFNEASTAAPEDDYGVTKYEAEKCLVKIASNTNMDVVIIRPPLIYGEGVKANFKRLIKFTCSGLPMPFGKVKNKRSLLFIGNLVDFIMVCVQHDEAANQTFLVSDDDDVSTMELIKAISYAHGKTARLIPVPIAWITLICDLLGKQSLANRLCGDLQIDISKAKALLNWIPPYSFKEGIIRTVKLRQPK